MVQDAGCTWNKTEVNYDIFVSKVWPDIRSHGEFNPSLIWSEIVSFIKGSVGSLDKPDGCLTIDEYTKLGKKRSPNFVGSRAEVYRIFLEYERVRKSKSMYDLCDVVRHVYAGMKQMGGYVGVPIHSSYVDEVGGLTPPLRKG